MLLIMGNLIHGHILDRSCGWFITFRKVAEIRDFPELSTGRTSVKMPGGYSQAVCRRTVFLL